MNLLFDGGHIERVAGWLLLALLAVGCLLVLKPFISSILWAAILGFATWPLCLRLRRLLYDWKTLPAVFMTIALAVALVLPIVLLGASLADSAEGLIERLRAQIENDAERGTAPAWLHDLPLLGDMLASYWVLLMTNTGELAGAVLPYLTPVRDLAVASGLTIGRGVVELSLSVLIVFFVYRDGDVVMQELGKISDRVLGPRGQHLIAVTAGTIRSVVYGLIGSALIQALLAIIGFSIVGVPGVALLGFLVFVLALLPVAGAPIVWIPVALWLFIEGQIAQGIFIVVWGAVAISAVDNLLKPYLISRGADLPFLLIFFGVIGGILAFGVLGIFLGPTLLAVGHAMLREWHRIGPDGEPLDAPKDPLGSVAPEAGKPETGKNQRPPRRVVG